MRIVLPQITGMRNPWHADRLLQKQISQVNRQGRSKCHQQIIEENPDCSTIFYAALNGQARY